MNEIMPEEEISKHQKIIDELSQVAMARLSRFAPAGHPYFRKGSALEQYFDRKFKEAGGMTPEISKELGW